MSIRMRKTRSKTGHRRSHHGFRGPRLSRCGQCNNFHIRHRACLKCGTYRGREYVDVMAEIAKQEKKQKDKELAEQQVGAQR